HASPYLLTGLLRDGMGFEGVLVSDWNDILRLHTVHRTARSYDEAIERSITAGVDMYMVPHDAEGFTSRLTALVEAGRVPQARIDEAVRRILTLKFALGLFERPYVDAERADETVTGVASDRALAREAARASLTLLKNDGVLPLGEGVRAVLVTGPGADSVAEQMGGWTIGWQGLEGGREVPPAVTVFEGLRDGAPAGTEVRYLSAGAAGLREAAQEADVAVVVVGERPYAEGEGDSQSLSLPEAEEALIRELAATGTPTVVVLLAGRPLLLETLADVAALLMAYLPGSETGTAVADVVFGDYNPSGRLPFSWPRSTGQLPLSYDRLASEAPYDPRFAFGYGLSYTSYSYQNARATVSDEAVTVSVEVSNTGARAGHEVVQVFVEPAFGSVLAPVQRLAGFETVYLEPGETATVSLELPLSRFAVLPGDVFDAPAAVVEAGSYGLRIAESYVEVVLP
nr:glycoside hydrolase family 3 C-terminal domain-containing protein [Deinococcota bacterium]